MAKERNPDEQKKATSEELDKEGLLPEDVLKAFPEEERERISSVVQSTIISGFLRRENPIANKITKEHVTQIIANSNLADE